MWQTHIRPLLFPANFSSILLFIPCDRLLYRIISTIRDVRLFVNPDTFFFYLLLLKYILILKWRMIFIYLYIRSSREDIGNLQREIRGLEKIVEIRIWKEISSNVFLCTNFRSGFVNELLRKITLANHGARSLIESRRVALAMCCRRARTNLSNVSRRKCVEYNKYFYG